MQDSGDLILTLKPERNSPPGKKIDISDKPVFLGVAIDPRLTWKPHLETVENKSIRIFSLMKKVGRILRQVYTGNVTPLAEYASSSWSTASNANKTRIDKVQNMGPDDHLWCNKKAHSSGKWRK